MKNLFKSLMLVAVAAMAFTSCQKENDEVNAVKNQYVIEFNAGFDAETRSHFGDKDGDAYPSFWDGGEAVRLEIADAESTWVPSGNADIYMKKVDKDGAVGTFTASYDRTFDGGVITAYVPQTSWKNEYDFDIQGYAWAPAIPGTQTPLAGSVEPAAHILKASTAFEGALPEHAQLVFEPVTAFAKMTLKLGDVVAFEDIDNVRVEFADQAYTLLPTNLSEPTFWFACEAAEVESMRVVITDKNEDTYVKEFTTESNPLAFKTGVVSTFGVGGFQAKSLDYVTSISASQNPWQGRYEFTIDTIDGAHILLYIYTWPEGGLLAETETEDGYADNNANHNLGYLYADYANWQGYADIKETSIIVEHLDEGYSLDFYFIDSKGVEWEFVYEGVVSGICNPPAPEAAEVVAVAESVRGNGEKYFTLNFTADNYKFTEMWFDTKVAGKIIAEGTFEIGGVVAYLNDEGASTGWDFEVEGTVTVAHDADNKQYNLTFDLEDGNGSTFTVTYAGKVEGVYSPGDATPLPNPSNVAFEVVNYTNVKVTWNAVEGANSYELYYDYWTDSKQESEHVTATETTYTFEGLTPGVYYTIYVKALPATAANTESEFASVYNVQVYNNPDSMETKYTFTKAVNTGSNKIKFSNENGEYCVIAFSSSLSAIAPGMYSSSASGDFYVDNWSSGFNGGTMYPFSFVNVEGEAGAEQTVTIVGAEYYGDVQVKAVFTGVIDMEVAPIEYTYATISQDGTNLSYMFSGDGAGLYFFYYANGAYGIDEGTYTFYQNTHYSGYYTYTFNYNYMTQIDLKVTGKLGEEQTYEFTLYTEYSGTIKAKYVGVLTTKVDEGGSDEGGSDEGGSDEGGSDEGGSDEGGVYDPWACTMEVVGGNAFSGYDIQLTGTGENKDVLVLSGMKASNVSATPTAVTRNGAAVDFTGTARVDADSYKAVFDITIGNTTYRGESSNTL